MHETVPISILPIDSFYIIIHQRYICLSKQLSRVSSDMDIAVWCCLQAASEVPEVPVLSKMTSCEIQVWIGRQLENLHIAIARPRF